MTDTTKKRIKFSTNDGNVSGPGVQAGGVGEKREKKDDKVSL